MFYRLTGSAKQWPVLAMISTAQLMVVLDISIVNVALPSMQSDLGFTNASREWVVTSYALAFGSLLLLGGRLTDLFGPKRSLLTGLVGFAAASALGGAAQSFGMLVIARTIQGSFGALLAPAALALLTATFTGAVERGKAFGIFGAVAVSGSSIGLLLGGGPDRGALLALDAVRQSRVRGAHGRRRCDAPDAFRSLTPRRPPRPRWCRHRLQRSLPADPRALQRRTRRMDRRAHRRNPVRGHRPAGRFRPDRVANREPAAALAHPRRPHPRRVLSGDRVQLPRPVRGVPVPDLLPPGRSRAEPPSNRARLPSPRPHHRGGGEDRHRQITAEVRPASAADRRPDLRGARHALARTAHPGIGLCRTRPSRDGADRTRRRVHGRSSYEHCYQRRRGAGRGDSFGHGQRRSTGGWCVRSRRARHCRGDGYRHPGLHPGFPCHRCRLRRCCGHLLVPSPAQARGPASRRPGSPDPC